MRKFFAILVTLLFLGSTLGGFAAPFPDLPADHWATNAVVVLAEKGLVEGYPDGTFRGRRPATRYEVSLIVARLLANLEKQKSQVTQEDLNTIKKLVQDYKDELDAQGVRLSQVEKLLDSLQSRVTELERVKWNGGFETRYVTSVTQTCPGCKLSLFHINGLADGNRLPFDPPNPQMNSNFSWNTNPIWNSTDLHLATRVTDGGYLNERAKSGYDPAVEGYPYNRLYPVVPNNSGSALTDGGYLNVRAKLGSDFEGGGVVSFFNNVGNLGNGLVYGVTPNTIANPFESATPSLFGTNLSANLNQMYVENTTQDVHIALGDWRPAYIPDFMLQGLPNMGIFGADYLPFYGGQIYGTLHSDPAPGLSYEAVAGHFSTNNNGAYQSLTYGGALRYSWQGDSPNGFQSNLTGSYVRVLNDSATANAQGTGGVINAGFWADPSTPLVAGSINNSTGIGPQTVSMYGLDLRVRLGGNWNWLSAFGKWGNSKYQPVRSSGATGFQIDNMTGNLYDGGLQVEKGRLSMKGEYLWVSPKYDPFIARIPILASSFSNSQPALWFSFPYPVAYGPPYTGVLPGPNALNFLSGNNNTNALTNGAGDVFYTIHDGRQYPNNRSGVRIKTDWDFGPGHIGGTYENLRQVVMSSLAAERSPGFYEPIFYTLQTYAGSGANFTNLSAFGTPNSRLFPGRITTYSVHGDYSFNWDQRKFTVDGLYINSQIRRLEPDFNNIDLLMNWWRGGLIFQPSSQWGFLGGYSNFTSGGAGDYLQPPVNTLGASFPAQNINGTTGLIIPPGGIMPANFRFQQKGPYLGVNYNFIKNGNAWILFQMDNFSDTNNSGQAGFASQQVQSGLQLLF